MVLHKVAQEYGSMFTDVWLVLPSTTTRSPIEVCAQVVSLKT